MRSYRTLLNVEYLAPDSAAKLSKSHLLTIGLEDYFQGKALAGVVDRGNWPRFETRIEKNTLAALTLLDCWKAKATFFVTAATAISCPAILREIVGRGHALGSAGVTGRSFRELHRTDLREELRRSKDRIEACSGVRVHGYRVADRRLTPRDLWALEILAEEGFSYDSSLSPSGFRFRAEPWRAVPHKIRLGDRDLWEFPLPALNVAGCHVPISGGNYFRQFPERFVNSAVAHWVRTHDLPFLMYFRIWDLDPDQPKITAAPFLARIRHYRNAQRMPGMVAEFLQRYRFTSVETFLDLPMAAALPEAPLASVATSRERAAGGKPVSIVIPCFNEETALPYLANTLRVLRERMEGSYGLQFILVDDGSSDGTWDALARIFGADPQFKLLRHACNEGVAAAILTGIREAGTEVVCSMDCDCTYDPLELRNMIPLLADGVDLVTASPYHPRGSVVNVPAWRLALSKTASRMYGMALRQPLHTYTSCFRVYRKSAVTRLQLRETGFLGVAEVLGEMALDGSRIVEHPARLETRMFGHSKMRLARTSAGHLRLMLRFAWRRAFSNGKESKLWRLPAQH